VADAVVADRSGQVCPTSDWFPGSDDEQVGVGAEAHQNIADISLRELKHRPMGGAGVVEDAMYSSPNTARRSPASVRVAAFPI
jgi:hypothetical protein